MGKAFAAQTGVPEFRFPGPWQKRGVVATPVPQVLGRESGDRQILGATGQPGSERDPLPQRITWKKWKETFNVNFRPPHTSVHTRAHAHTNRKILSIKETGGWG